MAGNVELPEEVSRMISGPEDDPGRWRGGSLAGKDQTGPAHYPQMERNGRMERLLFTCRKV